MGNPEFSIIIPTLNEEKLLEGLFANSKEAIRHTKHSVEVIVADGGSTDGTITIALRYADKIVNAKFDEVNNIASGRNAGAKNAAGDFLVFCNADILFDDVKSVIDSIYSEFETKSRLIAIAAWVDTFPKEEKTIDRIFHRFYNHYFKFLNTLNLGMGRGECIIVKKEFFEKAGYFNFALPAGEDFELFNRLIKLGKVEYSKKIRVFESPRRFRKSGYLRVTALWTFNALSIMLRKKTVSSEWKPVR